MEVTLGEVDRLEDLMAVGRLEKDVDDDAIRFVGELFKGRRVVFLFALAAGGVAGDSVDEVSVEEDREGTDDVTSTGIVR